MSSTLRFFCKIALAVLIPVPFCIHFRLSLLVILNGNTVHEVGFLFCFHTFMEGIKECIVHYQTVQCLARLVKGLIEQLSVTAEIAVNIVAVVEPAVAGMQEACAVAFITQD